MMGRTLNRREIISAMAMSAAVAATRPAYAVSASAPLDLLVVGDWGRNGSDHQRDVAVQMGLAAERRGVGQVISVGDNFYEDGVQSVNDPRWRTSFEDIYAAKSLQVPWYVALGNHDYRGVPRAQLDYVRTSNRWRMPGRYYKVTGRDSGATYLDMFVIDTSPLVNKYRENVHSAIAMNVAGEDVPAQLRWLDEQLGASTAPWKLVIGHHTIHSGGSGHGDTPEMVELIDPLLRKHGVQAYIHGHDHDLQHIRRDGVDYICSGAGSEVRPVREVAGTLFCVARSGFAAIHATADALTVEFLDYTGARLYQGEVPQGNRPTGFATS